LLSLSRSIWHAKAIWLPRMLGFMNSFSCKSVLKWDRVVGGIKSQCKLLRSSDGSNSVLIVKMKR
jgi:hypothetical protein